MREKYGVTCSPSSPWYNCSAGRASVNWSRLEVTAQLASGVGVSNLTHISPTSPSHLRSGMQVLPESPGTCRPSLQSVRTDRWSEVVGLEARRPRYPGDKTKFHHLKFYCHHSSSFFTTSWEMRTDFRWWLLELIGIQGRIYVLKSGQDALIDQSDFPSTQQHQRKIEYKIKEVC